MVHKESIKYYIAQSIRVPVSIATKPRTLFSFEYGHHYYRLQFGMQLELATGDTYYITGPNEIIENQCRDLIEDYYISSDWSHKLEFVESKEKADMTIEIHDDYGLEYTMEFDVAGEIKSKDYYYLPEPPYRE